MDIPKLQMSSELPPGLSSAEAASLRIKYGSNVLHKLHGHSIWTIVWDVAKEPMFILLMVATLLYFILGEQGQGWLMLVAMTLVAAISIFQEIRSSHALKALRKLTEPLAAVLRDGNFRELPVEEIVPGDIIRIEEGERVPADGVIIRSNDLSINESIVTGESIPVDKSNDAGRDVLYRGSTINAGMAGGWVRFIAPNTTLSPGTYWIVLHTGNVQGVARDYGDGSTSWYAAPDPFWDGASQQYGNGSAGSTTLSVYVSYVH